MSTSESLQSAIALHQSGDLDGAERLYRRVLEETPEDFDAWHLLGVLKHQQGKHSAAISHIEKALTINANSADAWFHLGTARVAQAESESAREAFGRALTLDPALPNAWNALGNLHQALGSFAEARDAYEKLLSLQPEYADGHYNLGHLYATFGRPDAAIKSVRRAMQLNPARVDYHGFLGTLFEDVGKPDKALATYQKGLTLEPNHPDLHYQCGFIFESRNELLDAQVSYQRAVSANPNHGGALSALLFLKRKLCSWQHLPELHARAEQVVTSGGPDITPFSWLLEPSSPAQQRRCAQIWTDNLLSRIELTRKQTRYQHAPRSKERLTIGYLSADYYDHPTAFLAAGLFEAHNRNRFKIIGYSNSPAAASPMRARLEQSFDEFVDINALAYREAADRIKADEVDILVDLKGYTLDAASEIMALRPAPVQVNYLGYPGTMAAEFIDYIVGDPDVTPFSDREYFSEAIVQLPDSYQVNDSRRGHHPKTPSRTELGLPEQGIVFACLNTSFKITPEMFGCWMRLLQAVPESSLLLFAKGQSSPVAENLRGYAGQLGVDPQRLVFVPGKPYPEYLAQFRVVDLFLDTRPYNAHTTASDALWEGCPVLTITGETFASRVGASLLRAVGFSQAELNVLICDSVAAFERTAIELANSPEKLKELRRHLEQYRDQVPLFDTQRFATHLENAYEEMMQRFNDGLEPEAFAVTAVSKWSPADQR